MSELSVKQVILMRKDLRMRRGKEIAQGAHAAMEYLNSRIRGTLHEKTISISFSDLEKIWLEKGMRKICLQVHSESELLQLHQQALAVGLQSHLILDSGRTEFAGVPTYTCCAIGPGESHLIDEITGKLTLY